MISAVGGTRWAGHTDTYLYSDRQGQCICASSLNVYIFGIDEKTRVKKNPTETRRTWTPHRQCPKLESFFLIDVIMKRYGRKPCLNETMLLRPWCIKCFFLSFSYPVKFWYMCQIHKKDEIIWTEKHYSTSVCHWQELPLVLAVMCFRNAGNNRIRVVVFLLCVDRWRGQCVLGHSWNRNIFFYCAPLKEWLENKLFPGFLKLFQIIKAWHSIHFKDTTSLFKNLSTLVFALQLVKQFKMNSTFSSQRTLFN